LFTYFVFAQSESVDLGKIKVEEKPVVEIEDNIICDVNDYGQSVTVFKSNAVELNSKPNIVDLTKDVAGVYFNKAGLVNFQAGPDAPSVIKIRGIGEKPNSGILTVIDDRPQSIGIWRHPLFDTLSLDTIESVEVVKGPASVEYGNQAVGGVINIKTKRMKTDGFKTIIGLCYGSYNSQDYFINNLLKKGRFDYNISAGYKSTAGDRKNSDSYQENYHIGLGYELSKNWYVAANADYADILFFNPGPTNENWERYQGAGETFQRDFDIRVEHNYRKIKGKILVYADTGLNKFFKTFNPFIGKLIPGSYNRYENCGTRIMEEFRLLNNNITKIGFDWQQFGGLFDSRLPNPTKRKIVQKYENDYSAYIITTQKFNIFSFSCGVRYAYNDKWGEEIIPQAGIKLSLLESQILYANVNKGYKTPAMGRIIWSDYDELEPEEFWQYETGLKHLINDSFFYNISVYQIEGNNLLKEDPVDNKLKNTGKFVFRGTEADIWIKLFKRVKMGTLLSYLDPGNKTAHIAFFNGKAYVISRIMNSLSLKVETEFAKDRYDSNEKKDKIDDYIILNSNLLYNIKIKKIDTNFYIDAENILNKKYLVKKGYPVPGFVIKAGVLLKI